MTIRRGYPSVVPNEDRVTYTASKNFHIFLCHLKELKNLEILFERTDDQKMNKILANS